MNFTDYQMVSSLNEVLNGFNIKAKCIDAKSYRHFSFYDIELACGTRVNKITSYAKELALAMRTKTDIIVTPMPEKGVVRLHTTHSYADTLSFDSLFKKFKAPKDFTLPFLFGEDAEGNPLWVDMAKNPHMLVAGSTGSGKSCLLHTLIANAAKRNDTKLYLIDTKRVDFGVYKNSSIKTLIHHIAEDYDEAMATLKYAYASMEARYKYMSENGIQNFEHHSNIFDKKLIIIDEAADLMLYNKTKEFEQLLVKLAQKSRAAGIFIVIATQRPSVDVLTGLIKSNFPARVSCKVVTKTDSRIILDQHGAESLAGRGDAIIRKPIGNTVRFQVAFINPNDTVKNFRVRYN